MCYPFQISRATGWNAWLAWTPIKPSINWWVIRMKSSASGSCRLRLPFAYVAQTTEQPARLRL